jgi:hypothetical protein
MNDILDLIHCSFCCSGRAGDGGGDSDREGSITPTNESPPSEDVLEESTTPKDKVSTLGFAILRGYT